MRGTSADKGKRIGLGPETKKDTSICVEYEIKQKMNAHSFGANVSKKKFPKMITAESTNNKMARNISAMANAARVPFLLK